MTSISPMTAKGLLRTSLAMGAIALVAACGDDPAGPGGDPGPPPTVSAVEPAEGTVGTELRITGTNFRSGAGVEVGNLASPSVDVTDATELFALVPSGVEAGTTYDVTVNNADGTAVTFPSAFTPVPPTLSFVNGATKPSGNPGSTVIVEGSAFGDVQGSGRVLFSDGAGGTVEATIASSEDWTDTFILTTVPSSAASGPIFVETATGQSESLEFTVTSAATFSPSTITWTETQPLPVALSGHGAVSTAIEDDLGETVQYVYVTGGSGNDGVPVTDVHYNTIEADGSVTATWQAGTVLATSRTHHAMVAATPFNSKAPGSGFLFVMGGVDAAGGQPVSSIERIELGTDGTIGAPESAGTLPVPLHSFGAVIFRNSVYIAGGATTDNVPVVDVYRAEVDSLGDLGEWEELASMPEARAYHGFQVFGGFLYAAGGDAAAVAIDDANFSNNATKLNTAAHARINLRSGLLTDGWTVSDNLMPKSRSKHVTLAAGGSLFISSGLYAAAGTSSSENVFAPINADGTLGSFNGATGSNTLFSEGGVNLFNTRGVAYVDATGVAHVMILAGDNVNDPGNKSAKVLFY